MGSISTRNFEGIALGPALPAVGSTSYSVLLVADNGGGTQQHLYALVVNGVVAPSPMAQWRQGFWGTTSDSGLAADDADPDFDGLRNLLEYAMDRNPTFADSAGAVTYFTTPTAAGLHFTLTAGAPDVAVQMEKSIAGLQPGDWTTDGIMETRTTNGDVITVDAWVTDPAMLDRLFLRLRATEQ